MLNKTIDRLPFELHLPGYNFCDPGTKLRKRLNRGDVGINPLDEACREHDTACSLSKEMGALDGKRIVGQKRMKIGTGRSERKESDGIWRGDALVEGMGRMRRNK